MTHPIIELQTALIAAWTDDAELITALGGAAIFDAVPKGQQPPFVVIARHDIFVRDGDDAPGLDHRLTLHCWADKASRKAALILADRLIAVALSANLSRPGLKITHAQHDRTETAIDLKIGRARAAVYMRFYSEPNV